VTAAEDDAVLENVAAGVLVPCAAGVEWGSVPAEFEDGPNWAKAASKSDSSPKGCWTSSSGIDGGVILSSDICLFLDLLPPLKTLFHERLAWGRGGGCCAGAGADAGGAWW
jgi:hypothetical protein